MPPPTTTSRSRAGGPVGRVKRSADPASDPSCWLCWAIASLDPTYAGCVAAAVITPVSVA
jgi:hypothetical protein